MASRFVLTAQVQLQAPTNTRQVVNQIQQQLQGINVPINVQGGQQAAKQVNNITKATKQATTQAQKMGKAFGTSIRRFSAFSIASRGISLLTSGLANATNEAIAFEREMIKISQVTGKTMGQLKGLENTITDLATSFGVSSKSILSVGRILAQAGIQANDLNVALTALAKTELSPTFEDITKTAEGAVAILAQFGEGVGALERQLGAISRVAGQFAVESGDLISVIRRTGGVFKAAGGELEELIALFTSVRATTRESAESIATGLRTIFTRIQRPKTIEFLKQFGVELTDLSGKFVGPYEAVRRLSEVLSGLQEGDIQFVRIAEELGGFRQIGKVIPLLQQFEVAERARQAAVEGGTALDDDAAKAQKALAVQISKVKEEFQALIRTVVQSSAFQVFVKTALELSSAFIKISETLTPLLPLLATVAAFKFARGAAGFARGIGAGLKGTKGFNSGGMVPGTGNRDTVPAMLTPGEFVIRKSSVAKIGADNLAAMNAKGYNNGGPVTDYESSRPYIKRNEETYFKKGGSKFLREPAGKRYANKFNAEDEIQFKIVKKSIDPNQYKDVAPKAYRDYINAKDPRVRGIFFEKLLKEVGEIKGAKTGKGGDATSSRLDGIYKRSVAEVKSRKDIVRDSEIGNKVIGAAIDPKSANVDAKMAKKLNDEILNDKLNTINFGRVYLLEDKLAKEGAKKTSKKTPKARRNAGGGISGSDTVPAMLTPGEFVFSKKAAQSIGYSNLSRMNTQGVQGFNKGGIVGFQYFANGTSGSGAQPQAQSDPMRPVGVAAQAYAKGIESHNKKIQALEAQMDIVAEGLHNLDEGASNLGNQTSEEATALGQGRGSRELLDKANADASSVMQSQTDQRKALQAQEKALFEAYAQAVEKRNKAMAMAASAPSDSRGVAADKQEMTSAFQDAQIKVQDQKIAEQTGVNYQDLPSSQKSREQIVFDENRNLTKLDSDRAATETELEKVKAEGDKGTGPERAAREEKIKALTDNLEKFDEAIEESTKKLLSSPIVKRQNAEAKVNDDARTERIRKENLAKRNAFITGGKEKQAPSKSGASSSASILSKILARLVKINRELRTFGKNFNKSAKAGLTGGASKANKELQLQPEKSKQSRRPTNKSKAAANALAASGFISPVSEINANIEQEQRQKKKQEKLASDPKFLERLANRQAKSAGIEDPEKEKLATDTQAEINKKLAQKPKGFLGKLNKKVADTRFGKAVGLSATSSKGKGEQKTEESKSSGRDENVKANQLQNLLLAAGAMSAFVPQIEGATEGFGAVSNAIPGVVGGFAAMQAAAQSLPEFEIGDDDGGLTKGAKRLGNVLSKAAGGALKNAAATVTVNKILDAYNGTHLKAEQAIKAASEANDEASVAAAEKAAVESANAESLNKASAIISGGFGAAAGALESIPHPAAQVAAKFLKITGFAVGLAVKMGALEKLFGITGDQVTNFFAVLGQGPTTSQIKANTRYTIEAARTQRELAKAGEQAAEELKKIQSGELSASEALGEGGSAARRAKALNRRNQASNELIEANKKQNQIFDRVQQSFDSQGTFGGALLGAGFSFLTGGRRDANNKQNEQLRKEQIASGEQAVNDVAPLLAQLTKDQVTAAAATGGQVSFDSFLGSINQDIVENARNTDLLAGNNDQMEKLKKNFENQQKAVLDNIKFIKAMNFGLSAVTSGIDAYGASLNNLIASQESGFSTAAAAATTLGTAITSAGANISSDQLNQSLDLLGDNLRNFGANEGQVGEARDLISGLNTVQKGAADALAAVKEGFKGGSIDPVSIQKQLKSAILSAVPDDSPIRQRLIDAFPDEIPPDVVSNFLNTGDVSGILDQAFGPVSEQVQKQLIEPLNKMAEQERALIALAQQRRAAEQKLIEVQKRAIDTQIEAAKNLEFFGGAKFTPEKEFAARRDQANLVLQDAGISGLTTGSADDIRRASSEIMSRFSSQQAAQNSAAMAGTGAFGGVQGVEDDRRAELKAANIELAEITKRGIEQRKQELELIQKKNQAEKDALNSLLGGDVEAFFEQSSAAAAGTALRSGNAAAASLFSASSLGKGLQGLQGTGLSDAENRRASQLTFGAFGLGDRAASIFSGTTTEEQRIKAEGRELSQLQSELGDQAVDLEQMTVDAKTVVITAANMEMQRISDEVTRTQNIGVNYNSRGGVIYANRGMFVPRGTDTVPAMLTPGEFVVNRAAVNRGNNLQILRAMNGGMGSGATNAAGTPTMNRGGLFGRRESPSFEMPDFSSVFDKFSEAVDKLAGLNISVKLDTTNVNVNFNGTSFLSTLDDKIRTAVISEVSNQTSKLAFNETGNIKTGGSVLGDIG